ncbi:MAG TPA: hypothetical protein VK864_14125 [Longimicrobiales bacterium]|nr:hypothetical protein [Longimicrobiales bacterium]
MPPDSAATLRGRISERFHDLETPTTDTLFDALARDVFAFQFEHNAPYAAYCRKRGLTPARIAHWSEIPPVPTAAFKEVALVAGTLADAQAVFRTSGTTRGSERRGAHYILDLALYHEALLPMFAGYVLPDDARLPMFALVPDAAQAHDSSLAHMISVASRAFGASGSRSFLDPQYGLDEPALEHALDQHVAARTPVCLLGTAFAFVHWLDSLTRKGKRFALPDGSRLMDTGGFKGRSRIVPAHELRAAYHTQLGIPEHFVVNEYGMTELCSQFYDPVLRHYVAGRGPTPRRVKRAPPWVRTRAVHPDTLQPVGPEEVGILQHFDLANLFSVMAVQTEDLGRIHPHGIETLGRVEGAAPRGCSVAVDLLLAGLREKA